jgi:hypothetical protein
MRSFVAVMLVLSSGCGRFSFSESPEVALDAAVDAAVDAVPPKVPTPIHRYKLAGSFADEAGGPALVGMGGALDAALGYRFETNRGLKLVGAMPVDAYTIDLRFRFLDIGACNPGGQHFCKLLDFKNLDADEGLYVLDEKLHFVISTIESPPVFVESGPVFIANREATVTLTRAANGATAAYVNRAPAFSFIDSTAMAKFSRQGQAANFAIDDQATAPREASGGSIREIAIWDVALTPAEISALP